MMRELNYQQKVLLANYEISKESNGIRGLDRVWYSETGELFFRTQKWVNDEKRVVSGNYIVTEDEIYVQVGATKQEKDFAKELENKVRELFP